MELKTIYKKYQNINQLIPNINNGGCGIFAEKLHFQLVKLGLKPKLVALTNNKKSLAYEIKLGAKFNTLPAGSFPYEEADIVHIINKVGNFYIDSTGIYSSIDELSNKHNYPSYKRQSVFVDMNKLQEWNNNPNLWACGFNRKNISKIEKLMAKYFEVK